MKTIKLLFLLIFITCFAPNNVKSQLTISDYFNCSIENPYPNTSNSPMTSCEGHSAAFLAKYGNQSFWIPSVSNPSILTIKVNLNIMQDGNGSGNFSLNDIESLEQIFNWMADIYQFNDQPSDPINGVFFIPDTYIRFEIGGIYFYNESSLHRTTSSVQLLNYLRTNYPERLNELNIFFTEPLNTGQTSGGTNSLPSLTNFALDQCIVTYKKFSIGSEGYWACAGHLAHEMGHVLGLLHTYGGISCCPESCIETNMDYLDDVFGNDGVNHDCYHDSGFSCNPFDSGNTCTNNIMGGTQNSGYFSPKQIGRIHRSLNTYSTMRYVKCSTSENDLEISSDEIWDFGMRLYKNLRVKSGKSLTIKCKVLMPSAAKIIIEPGGLLTIDGGTITSACEYPWQGIEVWGNSSASQHPIQGQPNQQGKLILNNATIENALCAVSLWKDGDYTKTGGIVQATNTIFRNNTKSVHILPYRNFNPYFPTEEMDYLASFTNCTFELDNDYHHIYNFYKHVDLNRVKGVKFNSCNFSLADNVQSVSPWNSAIASYSAGFSVMAPAGQTSTFSGFQSAIYAANTGLNTYSFYVNRALFDNNAIGINVKGVDQATVLNSTFNVGNGNYTAENCYYGIRMEQSSGFGIEENVFGKQENSPQANLIGISVVNCQGVEDVYRNTFTGLSAGNYAYGKNYINDGINGLTYTCNTHNGNYADIYVYGTTFEHGIQSHQGSFSLPAGNAFSNNASWNFYNGTKRLIGYYYNSNAALQYPAFVEYVVREGVSASNSCLAHYGGGNETLVLSASQKQTLQNEFATVNNQYETIKTLYGNLKDGGDTEEKVYDIATAQPGEMWDLRAKLLGDSPHISQEVLRKVADKTEVFTEAAIFDILAANPDELKNKELIEYLEQKEIPLPDYMIDILKQVAAGTTYKTVLQMQMARLSHLKARAAQDMLRSILADESLDMNQLRNWLHNLGGLGAERQIVASFAQEGRFDDAYALAQTLPQVYALEDEALEEHNRFVAMLQMQQQLQAENRDIEHLTEIETAMINDFAVSDAGLAGALARSIVETRDGQPLANCPSLQSEASYKTGAVVNPGLLGESFGLSLSVKPNPANSWTAFDFTLPEGASEARIEITSPAGVVIHSLQLSGSRGQKLFDSRKLSPGVYNCSLIAGGFSQTVKLIIQH